MEWYSSDYWDNRYVENNTGWDIGAISTPLKAYIDQLEDKNVRILIPGAGNAYEAAYLYQNGFEHVHVLDWSEKAIENVKRRLPSFPSKQLHVENFFFHKNSYDLIIEQTFFCALPPDLRNQYVQHTADLLRPAGKLVGLLFDIPLQRDAPPFGGSKEIYQDIFAPFFDILVMEKAYNSIPPRKGNELFIKMVLKQN